ncbi:UBP-type zinc finger domain-containing protein [Streptomyces sp. NPDC097619]|uniref:UBP-type zinc finger domain-containing protein n=1 Tax=Streptomyces sp. NPDC097619 TaxID=3157228 RepID=UPI00332E86E5
MAGEHDRWQVAPDGGRVSARTCDHLELLHALRPHERPRSEETASTDRRAGEPVPAREAVASPGRVPPPDVARCADCEARGLRWVRLRWCVTCGYVGCCDSSRAGHAHAHHVATGHPLVLSLAPDEHWAWCYPDELFLVRATAS